MASGALPQMTQAEWGEEMAEVQGTLVYETVDAWRVELVRPGQRSASTVWLPKKNCERADRNTWLVPEWLADKEDLI